MMSKKIKLSFIITSIVLLVLVISLTSASFAIWTSSGGIGEGGTSVAPPFIADREYVWAKYFDYEVRETTIGEGDNQSTVYYATITTFYKDVTVGDNTYVAGVNLEDVIIPASFTTTYNGKTITANVERISNQIFKDSTLKELPVTIYIPATVTQIDMMAFANLPNLEKVVFLGDTSVVACNIADYAFIGCLNLVEIETQRTLNVSSKENVFIGCESVTIPSGKLNESASNVV